MRKAMHPEPKEGLNKPFETDLRKRASLACSVAQWRRYAYKWYSQIAR